jgi:hypothetical protein
MHVRAWLLCALPRLPDDLKGAQPCEWLRLASPTGLLASAPQGASLPLPPSPPLVGAPLPSGVTYGPVPQRLNNSMVARQNAPVKTLHTPCQHVWPLLMFGRP